MADVVGAIERLGSDERLQVSADLIQAVEVGMAGLSKALGASKVDLAPVVEALRGLKINVPAPAVHFLPAPVQKGATWVVTVPDAYGGPDREFTIKRVE